MLNKRLFGKIAEYISIFIYAIKMYDIVKYNYNSKLGQIDLIAKRCNKIVFVEVKARTSLENDDLITAKQQERIRRSAENFLARNNKYDNYEVRFDLVVFTKSSFPRIFENAF